MRTLAFDGRMGASGDMVLGALIGAGADRDALTPVEDGLAVTYDVHRVDRGGIDATSVTVHSDDEPAEGHGPHRHYHEVVEIVEGLGLPASVESTALATFELLGEAEATVHGTDLEETHFHEVGADDAIADIVGTCLLLTDLDVERVVTTPVAAGGGEVETSHGTYQVPPPAVVTLAERADWTLQGGPVEFELLTPTGAALLAHLATGRDTLPQMQITGSGYGAGSREVRARPNVLRAIVGETGPELDREPITVLETNVDDVSPEVLGSLQTTLLDEGALDVTVVPLGMKKSRPGHLVRVVASPEDAEQLAEGLARETGTLGVREHGTSHRWVADREIVTADIELAGQAYEVDVKVGRAGETVYDVSAEFDDAMAVAREADEPVRRVMRLAEAEISD